MTDQFEPQPETLNPYLKTKVLTASPAELRMLLLDGALRFATQGRDGLEAKDFEKAYNGTSQCQAILMELISALNDDVDPQLCDQLRSLYVFMYTRLVTGLSERDATVLTEVVELLKFECDTWRMVMQQIASGEVPAADASPQPSDLAKVARQGGTIPSSGAAPGLIGGTISVEG